MNPELLIALIGLPAAFYGAAEGTIKLQGRVSDIRERRGGKREFIVLSTSVKYIMWENYSELIKLRRIRALRKIRRLQIDRYPRAGAAGHEEKRPVQNFYSLPGTASQRLEFFVVDLEPNDEFRAHREHSIVFGYTIPEPLSVTHPDEEEEGIDIYGPLGQERVSLEVHLPKTRSFGDERDFKVRVFYGAGREDLVSPKDYELNIDRAFKNTDISRGTDVLRLAMKPPEGALELRVRWPWYRVVGEKA